MQISSWLRDAKSRSPERKSLPNVTIQNQITHTPNNFSAQFIKSTLQFLENETIIPKTLLSEKQDTRQCLNLTYHAALALYKKLHPDKTELFLDLRIEDERWIEYFFAELKNCDLESGASRLSELLEHDQSICEAIQLRALRIMKLLDTLLEKQKEGGIEDIIPFLTYQDKSLAMLHLIHRGARVPYHTAKMLYERSLYINMLLFSPKPKPSEIIVLYNPELAVELMLDHIQFLKHSKTAETNAQCQFYENTLVKAKCDNINILRFHLGLYEMGLEDRNSIDKVIRAVTLSAIQMQDAPNKSTRQEFPYALWESLSIRHLAADFYAGQIAKEDQIDLSVLRAQFEHILQEIVLEEKEFKKQNIDRIFTKLSDTSFLLNLGLFDEISWYPKNPVESWFVQELGNLEGSIMSSVSMLLRAREIIQKGDIEANDILEMIRDMALCTLHIKNKYVKYKDKIDEGQHIASIQNLKMRAISMCQISGGYISTQGSHHRVVERVTEQIKQARGDMKDESQIFNKLPRDLKKNSNDDNLAYIMQDSLLQATFIDIKPCISRHRISSSSGVLLKHTTKCGIANRYQLLSESIDNALKTLKNNNMIFYYALGLQKLDSVVYGKKIELSKEIIKEARASIMYRVAVNLTNYIAESHCLLIDHNGRTLVGILRFLSLCILGTMPFVLDTNILDKGTAEELVSMFIINAHRFQGQIYNQNKEFTFDPNIARFEKNLELHHYGRATIKHQEIFDNAVTSLQNALSKLQQAGGDVEKIRDALSELQSASVHEYGVDNAKQKVSLKDLLDYKCEWIKDPQQQDLPKKKQFID
ncbi:hypothetical protein Sarmat_00500 [Rickettsiales endosymbiont of Paramecium tredecaurelia]|uniref:hypothetical protein n=1 Tax=Candidatus Sarmatiella mevalonica TaxID=2770581 RepID=UPI0019208CFA|nr:hypothetical protein [Candidatus Sarmatiella mevalonica]MBL3284649.1 hypothetical protein [Candidatus Sarmatiella mevalonica]